MKRADMGVAGRVPSVLRERQAGELHRTKGRGQGACVTTMTAAWGPRQTRSGPPGTSGMSTGTAQRRSCARRVAAAQPGVPGLGRDLQVDLTCPHGAGRAPFQTSEGQRSRGALPSSLGVEPQPAPGPPWDAPQAQVALPAGTRGKPWTPARDPPHCKCGNTVLFRVRCVNIQHDKICTKFTS